MSKTVKPEDVAKACLMLTKAQSQQRIVLSDPALEALCEISSECGWDALAICLRVLVDDYANR
jgi:hypothetical protein